MKWTKLKKMTEDMFCKSMKKRVKINSTAYGNCSCGRAFLTLDGKEIANYCTRAFWNTSPKYVYPNYIQGDDIPEGKYKEYINSYGEFSRQDIYRMCFEYVHKININDALKSENSFIQSLLVIDKRVGKTRLRKIDKDRLHPVARHLLDERMKVEKNQNPYSLKDTYECTSREYKKNG